MADTELAGVDVYEVDHPASQDDKRASGRPTSGTPSVTCTGCRSTPRATTWPSRLAAAGHDPARPTTWVWEGVVAYLTPAEVAATATVVAERSAPGSRLALNYQAPSWLAGLGWASPRLAALGGRRSPTAAEPRRSTWTPAEVRRLCGDRGLRVVRDDDLVTLAGRLGMPVTRAARCAPAGSPSPTAPEPADSVAGAAAAVGQRATVSRRAPSA